MSTAATEPTTVTADELRTGLTDLLAQVRETGTPLNVDGGFVVLAATEYARLLDQADRLETLSSVLKSIRQIDEGQYLTLEESTARIRQKHFGGKP
jgi:hypothetical protein